VHLAGVHPNYLSEAECGKKNFSLTTIEKISKALGAAVSELFSGRASTYSPKTRSTNRLAYLLKDVSPKEMVEILRAVRFMVRRK